MERPLSKENATSRIKRLEEKAQMQHFQEDLILKYQHDQLLEDIRSKLTMIDEI
jgi:hypothetical protein